METDVKAMKIKALRDYDAQNPMYAYHKVFAGREELYPYADYLQDAAAQDDVSRVSVTLDDDTAHTGDYEPEDA